MPILFIDLASHSTLSHEGACIACVDDTHTKAIHFIDERISDDGLMPALDHTLASAAWSYEDLTHIACVTGPGGFTSLRMAVSLANVLSDQLHIPLAGVHLSDVYRARAGSDAGLLWLHSTKRTHVFARTFGIDASQWDEATLVTLEELQSSGLKPNAWTGELIPEHRAVVEPLGWKEMKITSITDALPQLLQGQEYKKQILVPWYGRGW